MSLRVRQYKNRIKTTLVTAISVLAFVLQPMYGLVSAQVANATPVPVPQPLSVDATCSVDHKVVLTLTARQAEMPDLPSNAENWTLGSVKYTTDYGSKTQTLSDNDVDTYTVNTNDSDVDAGSVSAKVTGGYSVGPWYHFDWRTYNETLTANYDALNCDVTPPEAHVTYSPNTLTNGSVVATISADEAVQPVSGWTQPDSTKLQKTYTTNTAETVTVKDLAGNATDVNISIDWIDNSKPVGNAVYTGGVKVGDVIYVRSINNLKFTETIDDNNSVVRATYLVQKWNSVTNKFEGFCGNWNANSLGSHSLGGTTHETYTENNVGHCAADQSQWTDGKYQIFHAAYDKAGNEGKYNTNRQVFVIDNTKPEVTDFRIDNPASVYKDQIKASAVVSDTNLKDVTFYVSRAESTYPDGSPKCTGNGAYVASAPGVLNAGRYEATIDTSSLNGDDYCVSVISSDLATNHSVPAGRQLVAVDNKAPDIQINNAEVVGNPYFKLGKDINVHVIDDNLADTQITRLNVSSDNHWDYHAGHYFGLGWLRDGDYSMTSTDAAGNSTTVTFRVDHTKPVVSGTLYTGGVLSGSTLYNPTSFTLSANDDSSNNAKGDIQSGLDKVVGNIYKYDPTNAHAGSDGYYLFKSHSTSSDTLTVDLSGLTDGKYYVRYNAADVATNVANTEEFNFVVDSTAPAQPTGLHYFAVNDNLVYSLNDMVIKRQAIYPQWDAVTTDVNGSAEAIDHYNYESRGGYTTTIAGTDASADGTIKNWVPPTDGPDGFRVQAVDKAGNVGEWSDWIDFDYDSTPPTVSLDTSLDGKVLQGPVDVTGSISDAHPDHYWVQVKKDGVVVYDHTTNDTSNFSGVLRTLNDDGVYEVTLAARDAAGGTSTSGNRSGDVSITFTIDNTAPVVTVTPVTGAYGFVNTVNVHADIDDAASYTLYVNSSPVASGSAPFVDYSLPVATGTYSIYVEATDAAGNTGTSLVSVVTVDDTAPLLSVKGYTGTSLTPTITGTTDGADDVVTVDGALATVNPAANSNGTYDWTYKLPTQSVGTHTITVVSTDTYGNATTTTASVKVKPATDTTPTTVTTVTPAGTTTDNAADQGVLGTSTSNTSSNKDVLGASTQKDGTWNVLGLAWYWWLLILAAIIAAVWAIIAAIRRRQANA